MTQGVPEDRAETAEWEALKKPRSRDEGTYALTSYGELADLLTALPLLLREARRQRGLSMRDAAAGIGVGFTTISRVEDGADASLTTAIAVLRWLDQRDSRGGP